jgi:hypothetical protein
VAIHEGRLWWAGLNAIWGSVSDAYDSFDETFVGDAGPINRTIGAGPVDTINWMVSLKGLLIGAQGAEFTARSSSLDEPLTPTNFNLKASSTQGSAVASVVKVDQAGYFVDRTGCKVFEMAFDVRNYDYTSNNLMELCPELGLPGIVRIDVQRKPDTRIHCVRADGVALVGVVNRAEDVLAWFTVETSGEIEDVAVLPAVAGDLDDQVYYVVKRTVDGATVRYLEKWAQEIDCRGDALCLLADSYVTYSGGATTTIPAAHLEGEAVVVWADSADVGTDDSAAAWTQVYTVTDGVVTLETAATNVVVGLPYEAEFKSSKLGVQMEGRAMLGAHKKTAHVTVLLSDTHRKGIRFGADFDHLDDMPGIEEGVAVTQEVSEDYDHDPIEFPGTWSTDSRVCIKAAAPRPATVTAIAVEMEQN